MWLPKNSGWCVTTIAKWDISENVLSQMFWLSLTNTETSRLVYGNVAQIKIKIKNCSELSMTNELVLVLEWNDNNVME